MQYLFNTKNTNKSWYTKASWSYLKTMLLAAPEDIHWYWRNGLDILDIIISPLSMAKNDPFVQAFIKEGLKINLGIPFGITGEGQIKVFVNDDEFAWKFYPDRIFPSDMQVLLHEFAHYLLRIKDPDTKVKLRYPDTSGHKAGTILDWATAEVHDLDYEGRDWRKYVEYKTSIFGPTKTFPLLGIDVRTALRFGPSSLNTV